MNIILRQWLLPETLPYIALSGAQDRRNIDLFIRGLKNGDLWDVMVEGWTLRGTQNSMTATKAYGLRGNVGTLVASPTWQDDGVNFSINTMRMDTIVKLPLAPCTMITVFKPGNTLNNNEVFRTGGVNVSGSQFGISKSAGSSFNVGANGNAWPPGYNIAGVTNVGVYNTSSFVFIGLNINSDALTGRYGVNGSYGSMPNLSSGVQTFNDSPAPINFNINTVANTPVISFVAIFNTALSDMNIETVRTLYKSTIGAGLGLI